MGSVSRELTKEPGIAKRREASWDDLRKELLDEGFAISIYAVYRIANPASRVAINDRTLDRFLRGIRAIEKRRKIRL